MKNILIDKKQNPSSNTTQKGINFTPIEEDEEENKKSFKTKSPILQKDLSECKS